MENGTSAELNINNLMDAFKLFIDTEDRIVEPFVYIENRHFWKSELSKVIAGKIFTDDEIQTALKNEGFLGIFNGLKCYVTRLILTI